MSGELFKCSICGATYSGWGNNPWPVTQGDDDRCCDGCNKAFVIPARLGNFLIKNTGDNSGDK